VGRLHRTPTADVGAKSSRTSVRRGCAEYIQRRPGPGRAPQSWDRAISGQSTGSRDSARELASGWRIPSAGVASTRASDADTNSRRDRGRGDQFLLGHLDGERGQAPGAIESMLHRTPPRHLVLCPSLDRRSLRRRRLPDLPGSRPGVGHQRDGRLRQRAGNPGVRHRLHTRGTARRCSGSCSSGSRTCWQPPAVPMSSRPLLHPVSTARLDHRTAVT
jgi:hypothetical protein